MPATIGRDACGTGGVETLTFPMTSAARGSACTTTLINQGLFGLYQAGAFEIVTNASALGGDFSDMGVSDVFFEMAPLAPPVVTACSGTQELQMGDIYGEATFDYLGCEIMVPFWATAIGEVALSAVDVAGGQELQLDVVDVLFLDAELGQIEGGVPAWRDDTSRPTPRLRCSRPSPPS